MFKRPSAALTILSFFEQKRSRRVICVGSPISISSEDNEDDPTASKYDIQSHISELHRKVTEAEQILHVLLDKLALRETQSRRSCLEKWQRRHEQLHTKHALLIQTWEEGGDKLAKIMAEGPDDLFSSIFNR